jgi:phospholipid/cholesterol/gamma-HCH transport system permease protein
MNATAQDRMQMPKPAGAGCIRFETREGRSVAVATGDWTLPHYATIREQILTINADAIREAQIDISDIAALDTAGASLLSDLFGPARLASLGSQSALSSTRRALVDAVGKALIDCSRPPAPREHAVIPIVLARIGCAVEDFGKQTATLLGFIGLILETFARTAFQPRHWRVTSLVAQVEQIGLDAVPILSLLSFMVGAVVAFLGESVLKGFGASIYTVDLVAYAFLREFGVILTAILLAGRTASAFAAQIGSMKAREEIDALRTLGLDPVELLVMPRVLALLISLPLLTFIAMMTGIIGGALVCQFTLGTSPTQFISIFKADIKVSQFLIGIAKAPFFAFLIGTIGCMEGFKVSGSAQSVGEHTTSSVVQSIFVVILVDAIAAIFYMQMGW